MLIGELLEQSSLSAQWGLVKVTAGFPIVCLSSMPFASRPLMTLRCFIFNINVDIGVDKRV